MTRDGVLALVLLGIAALYYIAARAIPSSDLADTVGPAGLPTVYATVLAALALGLLARGWHAGGKTSVVSRSVLVRSAGILAIGVGYLVLVPYLGYPLAIASLIVGTALCQGGRLGVRLITVGGVGALVLWLLFVQLLGVSQPTGAWVEWLMGAS